jgi:hydroxymethylbilane synthase
VVSELKVTTTGDRVQDQPLNAIGGKGLFVKEVEEAILAGRADLAVHSMKDVPAKLTPTLAIGCVPRRADARDVVLTREGCPLAQLPPGSRVGTSSLRRRVQLLAWRPDLSVVPLRGNVDTRIRRCTEGVVDAVILAQAGLLRLGRTDLATESLDPSLCLPAAGQGALAIEQRADDTKLARIISPLSCAVTAIAAAAERGVMMAVEGSCQIPVGAYAVRDRGELWLRGLLADPDGSHLRKDQLRLGWPSNESDAHRAGLELGRALRQAR